MKLQTKRDIFRELDWLIDEHQRKGGNDILRIDVDDFEWSLILGPHPNKSKLMDSGTLRIYGHESNGGPDVHYRTFEVKKV